MALLIVIVAVALAFDFTNGFHDTANAIATSVSTRALSPRVACSWRAVMNMLGALRRPRRSRPTVGKGIVALPARLADGRPRSADRRHRLEPDHLVLRASPRAPRTLSSAASSAPRSSRPAPAPSTGRASGTRSSSPWSASPIDRLRWSPSSIMNVLLLIVHRWSPQPVNRTFRTLAARLGRRRRLRPRLQRRPEDHGHHHPGAGDVRHLLQHGVRSRRG